MPKTNLLPTADECASLLGRTLTDAEEKNYDLWLAVATARLNALTHRNITEWEKPDDFPIIKLLLARLVSVLKLEQETSEEYGMTAKTVEDFKIEYDTTSSTPMREFVRQNEDLLKLFDDQELHIRIESGVDPTEFCI